MSFDRALMITIAGAALWAANAAGDPYSTQSTHYGDCIAPDSEQGRQQDCAAFLQQTLAIWNMRQSNPNVCSRYSGNELRGAYARYWQSRGFAPEEARPAEASVMDFLNSETQACK